MDQPLAATVLLCCLATLAAAAEELVVCARRPEPVPGVKGQALNFVTSDPGMFDGANTTVLANGSHPFLAGASGTVALWFKASYLTKGHSVLFELGSHRDGMMEDCDGVIPRKSAWPGEGFALVVKPERAPGDGRVKLWGCAGGDEFGLTSPAMIDLKAWHHAALVWQPGRMSLFVDGKLAESAAIGQHNDFELARHVRIASDLYGGNAFNGALDEIQAFSRALAAEEIAALAAGGDLAADPALALHMPCDARPVAQVVRRELTEVLAGKTVFRADLGQQRFAPVGAPIIMRLSVASGAAEDLDAETTIRAENNDVVFRTATRLRRDPAAAVDVPFSATLDRCGVYQLECTLKNAGGEPLFARSVRFAVIAALPPLAEIPDSSPAGFWSDTARTTLGFKWTRLWDACGCSWGALEPRKGEFHWDYLDATLADITARGGRALLCLTGTPAWASSMPKRELAEWKTVNADGYAVIPGAGWAGLAAYPPTDLGDFETFLRQLFRRYRGRITAYECWNEPDTSHFKGTPEQYVDMLKTMHRVLREEDPKAILVGGVGSGYPPWTAKIFSLGAAAFMDVLAIHPYCMIDPVADHRTGQLGRFIAFLRETEKQLGRPLPVWGDELGTTYSPLGKAEFIKKYGGETATPEGIVTTYKEQSIRWDLGIMLALVGMGDGNKYFPGGTNNAHYDAKSVAYAALAKAVSFRTSARFIPVNDQSLGVMIDSAGSTGPQRIAAIWGSGSAIFRLDAPQVTGMDMYGNPIALRTEGGLLKLQLDGDILYLFDVPADFAGLQVASFTVPAKTMAGQTFAGELTLRNPYAHQETFRLQAKAPDGWSVGIAAETATLAPGAQLVIPLSVRSGPASGDIELEISASDAQGNVFPSWNELFNLAILPLGRYAGSVVAGEEASWREAPRLAQVDSLQHVSLGRPNLEFPDMPHWRGAEDLSYTIRGGWREDGLHLWIEVVDDHVHPGKAAEAPWNMDAVELFVDLLNGQTLTGERTNTEQFVVIPSLGTAFAPCEVKLCNDGTNAKVQFFGRRTERGYIVAGRIFYRSYAKLRPGMWLGLDVKVDDCDDPAARDTRKSSMTWKGDEQNSSSSARWGRFVLAE